MNRRLALNLLLLAFALSAAEAAAAPLEETATAPAQAAPSAAPAPQGAPASGQTTPGAFGGAFSKNSGKPIDIESDTLVVHDQQKYATFKGNVKAVQGTTTLRSKELDVHYAASGSDTVTSGAATTPGKAAPSGNVAPVAAKGAAPTAAQPPGGMGFGEGGNQITKIEARGNVVITSDQDQTTTSEWALYDVLAQLVTVGGNVVLTQGKNVLKGDRLVIDLKTGESKFENTGNTATGSKIRALFMPEAASKDGTSSNGQASKTNEDKSKPAEAENSGTDSAASPEPLFPGLPR
jgi:lipopolysaccharide export system protein LptA